MNFDELCAYFTQNTVNIAVRLVVSSVILFVGFKLIKFFDKRIKRGKLGTKINPSLHTFLSSFLRITLKAVLIVTVAAYLGVPMTSIITLLGSAGVAIGLALQGGLSNIAGGIMILAFKPFLVGDYISAANVTGTVCDLGLFYTKIISDEHNKVVIPNSKITGETVTNYSAEGLRRAFFDFTVAYDSDIDEVRRVMLAEAVKLDNVLGDPAPEVCLTEHGDSALKFSLRLWLKSADYWNVKFALAENIKKAFDAASITIPSLKMDVHLTK